MKKGLFIGLMLLLLIFGCSRQEEAILRIDHIILAIEDLDRGMRQFEEITGLKPVYGGEHPNSNTQNAIVALQDGIYLEILAPKTGLDSLPAFFQGMDTLTPIGFALNTDDIVLLDQRLKALQFSTDGIQDGSRTTPNGSRLSWQLLIVNEPAIIMNPFFIDWSPESKHPAMSEDNSCKLDALYLTSPFSTKIKKVLEVCESDISLLKVEEGMKTILGLTLKSPQGVFTF